MAINQPTNRNSKVIPNFSKESSEIWVRSRSKKAKKGAIPKYSRNLRTQTYQTQMLLARTSNNDIGTPILIKVVTVRTFRTSVWKKWLPTSRSFLKKNQLIIARKINVSQRIRIEIFLKLVENYLTIQIDEKVLTTDISINNDQTYKLSHKLP